MRRIILGFMFLILIQGAALAQGRGWGYAVGGVGGIAGNGAPSTATFSVAGGGEGLIYKGFGFGAEVGYLAPFEAGGDGFGIFSVNPAYHFSSKSKVVPFITGGYSLAFRSGHSSGGNFGGGVQYWMKDHLGLRFEFRDHIFSSDSPHFYGFRVGIAFR